MTSPSEVIPTATVAQSEGHSHDGVVEVRVSWWLSIGIGAMLGIGLAWLITREQSETQFFSSVTEQARDELRTRMIVQEEIARMIAEESDSAATKAESDEDKVL